MADEKKPEAKPAQSSWFSHEDPFVEFVWTIVTVFIVLYLINGVVGLVNSGSFSLFGFGITDTQKTIPLSKAPTLLGGKVETSKNTAVFSKPGENQIATKPAGSKGVLTQGPVIKDGIKYWYVKFDDGIEGWVPEGNLNYLKLEKQPLSEVEDPEGGRVSVAKTSTPVFSEPGVNQIATKRIDAEGDIIGGPVTKDGIKYWKVRFNDGTLGWVAENDLNYIKTNSVPLSSMPTIIGGTVLASRNGTALFDTAGGRQIDTVNKDTSGKIIEGPVIKDGIKYWHIKFDNGKEGWVAEGDLEYVEGSEFNLVTKTTTLFKRIFSIFKVVSLLLSILLIWFVIHLWRKIRDLRIEEANKFYVEKTESASINNTQWERVVRYVESTNESDWRLAILEADNILESLLKNMMLPGETTALKLKAVEKSDFVTIDSAWEAHKIRNQIAHEGGTFVISQHEAKRVIGLYQTVFEEFRII